MVEYVFLWSNTSEFGRNSSIFGRTDLRKGVSEAKFDVEAAGDVKNSKISPKSAENHEKPEIVSKKISKKFVRRRKIESCKSSETRFPEVSCRSEPSSRGERTFEVRIFMVEYVRNAFSRSFVTDRSQVREANER